MGPRRVIGTILAMRAMRLSLPILIGLGSLFFANTMSAQTVPVDTMKEVEITAEPLHHLVLENRYVRVYKVEIAPHSATLLHRHRHDYVFVTLGEAHILNEVEGKAAVEVNLTDGDTRFTAGDFAHVARNLAETPFRNVTIELMQDEKKGMDGPSLPGEAGDETLRGRREILFRKDGARVWEMGLEPGVGLTRDGSRPGLLVALGEVEVDSGGEGRTEKLAAGDIHWFAAEDHNRIRNAGERATRFVMVEF